MTNLTAYNQAIIALEQCIHNEKEFLKTATNQNLIKIAKQKILYQEEALKYFQDSFES